MVKILWHGEDNSAEDSEMNKKERKTEEEMIRHYVNISVLIKMCCISVIPSYILSILFMKIIYKLSFWYKRKLNRHENMLIFNS